MESGAATVRAFVAIELPFEVRSYVGRLASSLKAVVPSYVRWVDPQGMHLTLKFLGNVPTGGLPEMERALAGVAAESRPFGLSLAAVGGFPDLRQPRVIWLGLVNGVAPLISVQRRVEEALVKLGYRAEERPFAPHLTLGRVREGVIAAERRVLGQAVATMETGDLPAWQVEGFSLMRSQLTPRGAVYTRLADFPFGDGLSPR